MENINTTDLFGNTSLIIACMRLNSRNQAELVRGLIRSGADCFVQNKMGCTALHKSVRWSVEISRVLLDEGAPVDGIDYRGMTPLHYAVMHGQLDCVELLVKHKADVNYQKIINLSESPLYYAHEKGYPEIVKFLVDNGAHPLDTNT